MRFGLFGGPSRGAHPDDAAAYAAYLDAVVEAEALGFTGVYLVEHHFTGRGQPSASLALLAHLAARTRTMRLGTAVVVVPWHHPLLLAEQAATVDVLSGGRFDLGVGRGYRDYEFRGFGIDAAEAAERFDEAMAVLRLAWTAGGRFSHHGRHWRFEDVLVEPAPVQRPHPPLWMGAASHRSIERAAREGYRLFLDQVGTFEQTAARGAAYRAAKQAAGFASSQDDVAVTRGLRIATSRAERDALVERQLATLTFLADASAPPRPDGPTNPFYSPPQTRRETVEAGAIIGTPDECIERLGRLRAGGIERVLFSGATLEELRLFAREVMPAFG
ncbi:MAG: LLM class flavin-dependent oxidoreductase [Chloroflexi bacterium]|nr:LLM class flavin-dependent oxidoreductase [Chloroflexota bacterium]